MDPESLVYVFLKMHLFYTRVEVFSFFHKYWISYARGCESGATLWQRRCLNEGVRLENIRC